MDIQAIRGAIQAEENKKEQICSAVQRLLTTMCSTNHIAVEDIISIQFSQTKDLNSANPATCLRQIGFEHTPLFCTQEPDYSDSKERIIRVLMTYRNKTGTTPQSVYLGGAKTLRGDLK